MVNMDLMWFQFLKQSNKLVKVYYWINLLFYNFIHVALFTLLYVAVLEWVTSVTWITSADWSMIDSLAQCIHSTSSRARVLTFILLTYSIRGAVRVYSTFRSTSFVWVSEVSRRASAWACVVLFPADCIASTWGRRARCGPFNWYNVRLHATRDERIAIVPRWANTHGCMAHNSALCFWTTSSHARVWTFVPYACHVAGTFTVAGALGATVRWWSNKRGHARARRGFIDWLTNRVGAARRWHAWIYLRWSFQSCKWK